MAIKICRGKFSKKVFGIQFEAGRYTLQFAYGKVGIYNSQTCKWLELI